MAVAEVTELVKRKRGEWEVEEGRRVETGGVRKTIGQWKRTVVREAVTGLMASMHANVDLDTKNRKKETAGTREGLTGGRGSGGGEKEKGKGKGKERQRSITPPRQDSQELRVAKERITSLEKQMWALMRHMGVQWDSRNQGIAPMERRAPRAPPPGLLPPALPHLAFKKQATGANMSQLGGNRQKPPAEPKRRAAYPPPPKNYGTMHVRQEMRVWDEKEKERTIKEDREERERIGRKR